MAALLILLLDGRGEMASEASSSDLDAPRGMAASDVHTDEIHGVRVMWNIAAK